MKVGSESFSQGIGKECERYFFTYVFVSRVGGILRWGSWGLRSKVPGIV